MNPADVGLVSQPRRSSLRLLEVFSPPQPVQFGGDPRLHALRLRLVDLGADYHIVAHLDPQPVSLTSPGRQLLPVYHQLLLLVSHQKDGLVFLEPIYYRLLLHHPTSNGISTDVCCPSTVAVTTIRHTPGVVLAPTFHCQLAEPSLSAVWGPRPLAWLFPLL